MLLGSYGLLNNINLRAKVTEGLPEWPPLSLLSLIHQITLYYRFWMVNLGFWQASIRFWGMYGKVKGVYSKQSQMIALAIGNLEGVLSKLVAVPIFCLVDCTENAEISLLRPVLRSNDC
jgi:hypothetical protein